MKGKVTSPDVKSVVAGSERISSLFSSEQRAFFVAAETRAFLSGKGIDLSSEQQTEDPDRTAVLLRGAAVDSLRCELRYDRSADPAPDAVNIPTVPAAVSLR